MDRSREFHDERLRAILENTGSPQSPFQVLRLPRIDIAKINQYTAEAMPKKAGADCA